MRKLLVKIVQLLDGTPAVYGKRQSGQSVVELALITPILIVLLAGLVEIGWFANNYLTLLDVTRSGARRGAVLQDQKSPLFWTNVNSYVPNALLPAAFQITNGSVTLSDGTVRDNGTDAQRFEYRWMPAGFGGPDSLGEAPCGLNQGIARLFYNEVLCVMITSMEPLSLNPANGIDDIVVSGFGLQLVDPSRTADPGHTWWLAPYPIRPLNNDNPQTVVAARYPSNANECDVTDAGGTPVLVPRELRDPFDFNNNNATAHPGRGDIQPPTTPFIIDGVDDFTEVPGYDAIATNIADAEKQVGFSLFGNHKIPGTFCTGSDWTMHDVEVLMNLPQYDLLTGSGTDVQQKTSCLPSQGLVLVELHWEHEMLLKIPLLSPVYTAVGNTDGKMVINVWAAFPLSSAEPHILFPTPSGFTPAGGCDV